MTPDNRLTLKKTLTVKRDERKKLQISPPPNLPSLLSLHYTAVHPKGTKNLESQISRTVSTHGPTHPPRLSVPITDSLPPLFYPPAQSSPVGLSPAAVKGKKGNGGGWCVRHKNPPTIHEEGEEEKKLLLWGASGRLLDSGMPCRGGRWWDEEEEAPG